MNEMIAKIYAFVIDFRAVQLHEIIFKPILTKFLNIQCSTAIYWLDHTSLMRVSDKSQNIQWKRYSQKNMPINSMKLCKNADCNWKVLWL